MTKNYHFTLLEKIIFTILLLFTMAFLNLSGYIFIALIVIFSIFYFSKLKVGMSELLLILFSVFYFAFYCMNYDFKVEHIIIYLVGPLCAYLIGEKIIENSKSQYTFFVLLLILSIGFCIHGLLNVFAYLRSEHIHTYAYQRVAVDFWRNEIVSVTSTGLLYVFSTGLSFGVLCSSYKRKFKVLAFMLLVACLSATLLWANKTLLFMIFGFCCFRLFYILLFKKDSANHKVYLWLSVSFIASIIFIIFFSNIGGITDWLLDLKIVDRIGSDNDSRFKSWMVFFENFNFIEYSFGGGHMASQVSSGYLHNLWLDVYDVGGCFSFIFLVVFSFYEWRKFLDYKTVAIKFGHNNEYVCIKFLMLAIVLNCMVEPIIEANPYFFLSTIMILGAINGRREQILTQYDG